MYLGLKVKIPSDSAGITRKKSVESHMFIMYMNIITARKKDTQFLKVRPLVSALMTMRR